jgi:hypothetical protein
MKATRNTTSMQSKQGFSKKARPDVRDNMDSRQNKEIGTSRQTSRRGHEKKNEQ